MPDGVSMHGRLKITLTLCIFKIKEVHANSHMNIHAGMCIYAFLFVMKTNKVTVVTKQMICFYRDRQRQREG